jgi:Protein of unknown function (DUF1569)
MKSVFNLTDVNELIERINVLTPTTERKWGKMDVAQMLAHCNVTYEMIYTDKHPKPNFLVKAILKLFVKNAVVTEKPYAKEGSTAPQFVMNDPKNFDDERQRLVAYIRQTQQLGAEHFDGKDSHSFGALNKTEWNNMLYKHLDHHLTQFGV